MSTLWSRLSQRRDVRAIAAYGFVAFGVLQVADIIVKALELPVWVLRAAVVVVLLGFVVTLGAVWAAEWKSAPAGEGAPPRRRLPYVAALVVLGVLAIAVLRLGIPQRTATERARRATAWPPTRVGPPAIPVPPMPPSLGAVPFEAVTVPRAGEGRGDGTILPGEVISLLSASVDLAQQGETHRALQIIQGGIARDPDNLYLRLHEFLLFRALGQHGEASKRIQAVSSKLPADADWIAPIVRHFAGALSEGDLLKATGQNASRLAEAHYLLGRKSATEVKPQIEAAMAHYAAAASMGSRDVEVGWARDELKLLARSGKAGKKVVTVTAKGVHVNPEEIDEQVQEALEEAAEVQQEAAEAMRERAREQREQERQRRAAERERARKVE